jgi:Fe-S-cluster-containing hydrogenase component 2
MQILIILKDIDFAPDALPKINKPNKLKKSSLVFPYSCNNIATYNPLSVKPKKCVCFQNGRKFECLEKTFCDAISVVGETVEINTDKCNGCGACKIVCPYGAIK